MSWKRKGPPTFWGNRRGHLLSGVPSQATRPCDGTTARRCLCLRTGSGITEARPYPRALPPSRTTWAKWTKRIYFVSQSKWPLPRSLRASEPVDPRERGGNDGGVSQQRSEERRVG